MEAASPVASSDDVMYEPEKKQANRGRGEDDAVAAAQAQGPTGSSAVSRNLSSLPFPFLPQRAIAGLGGPTCAAGSQAWEAHLPTPWDRMGRPKMQPSIVPCELLQREAAQGGRAWDRRR